MRAVADRVFYAILCNGRTARSKAHSNAMY